MNILNLRRVEFEFAHLFFHPIQKLYKSFIIHLLILDRQLSPSVLGRSVFCESKLAYAIANGCLSYRDLGIWQEHLFLRIMPKFVILSSQHREAETVGGLPSRRRVFSHDYIFRIVSILFIARCCHQSGNSDWT